ncbi:MAG: aromatic-ring-hydroxylating dioxygenase subunit beta [Alphaproteobacteria bacterium]
MNAPVADHTLLNTVTDLLTRYVHCIDSDALEQWPDFFTADCVYKITTAENQRRNLPVGIIFANSKGMLRDRVAALRDANIYEAQTYRHIVSSSLITSRTADEVAVTSNFMVVRILQDGDQILYAVGRYIDRIALTEAGPLFREKLVVLDSNKIDTLLAIPL